MMREVLFLLSSFLVCWKGVYPFLDIDELKNIHYDIDIVDQPVLYGRTKDWWSYEFCYGKQIDQFHLEQDKIVGDVVTLGFYESETDWSDNATTDSRKNRLNRYHSHSYVNGTKCDINGKPRQAEVRFHCAEGEGDSIARIDEPTTCSYILTIHTTRICHHPYLKPPPKVKPKSVLCSPALTQDQFDIYLYHEEQASPRKYAFDAATLGAKQTSPSEEDPTILKVTLPTNLEKSIVKEILLFKQSQADYRNVSKRLTSKKLTDLYNSLASVGFKHAQITDAMKNTIGELPDGFSEKFGHEVKGKEKVRARFEEDDKGDIRVVTPQPVQKIQGEKATLKKPSAQEEKVSLKEWTLRYAQECDEDSEDEEGSDDCMKEIDPNEKYLELTAKLFDCQTLAQEAKKEGDVKRQKDASQLIAKYQKELKELEKHSEFDPRVKITSADKDNTAKLINDEKTDQGVKKEGGLAEESGDALEGAFALFSVAEEEAEKTPKPVPAVTKQPVKADIRSFEYTQKTWTGKSPKQFLIDWCRKNHPKTNPPKYNKIAVKNNWKCKLKVEIPKQDPLVVCPDILTPTAMEAQHLASILALYKLAPGQSIHQLLPPPYRDVWLEWMNADKAAKEAKKSEQNKPRDQFVGQLLQQIKTKSEGSKSKSRLSDDDDELETWEDLSDGEENSTTDRRQHPQVSSDRLKTLMKEKQNSKQFKKLYPIRQGLPVSQYKAAILDNLSGHPVILIAGETGSGKSTQIPQFILEDVIGSGQGGDSLIVCTQPRRISAISLANRVSQEIGEEGPGSKNSLCGYQIRFESKQSAATRLLYCTTGVLLRKMQLDSKLQNVSHIIVDEVHERSVQSDFLLIILKRLLQVRKDLKVILMSATMESSKFSAYFQQCPVISIPGRTFPVQVFQVEDVIEQIKYELDSDSPYAVKSSNLTEHTQTVSISGMRGQSSKVTLRWDTENDEATKEELLLHLDKDPTFSEIEGAVLVFLPGLSHIQELYEQLESHKVFSDPSRYLLIALHSMLSSSNQSSAFDVPPKGVRKVVLATNIAETGITIPDVVFVIDTGKAKENRYNEQRKMSSLEEVFISQASAKQRQGRAGRVREGICFRMYTNYKYSQLRSYTQPEIQRVPLEELCLHILKCNYGEPEKFLASAVDPPDSLAVRNAMALLREVGACTLTEMPELTPLGHHLSALPLNVRVGKMLVYAALFGCLEPVSVIAAAMTDKPPFVVPLEKRDKANEAKRGMSIASSDQLTIFKAYSGWKLAQRKGRQEELSFCRKNFLSRTNLLNIENVAKDLQRLIQSCGLASTSDKRSANLDTVFIPGTDVLQISHMDVAPFEKFPLTPENIALVKAVLTAGLYPNVARLKYEPSVDGEKDFSVLSQADTSREVAWLHPGSVKQSRVFLRDSTLISPYSILLFGGDITVQHREQLICVDDWIKFQAPAKTAVIFKELRELLDSLLSRKLANPTFSIQDEKVIQDLLLLLQSEGR
ncbi:ATP-dependent RNA helicase dhx29 [Holothuria leucospilota]|uniref:Protein OS-9 n=1 Tax=Holothuria leucospilota TaxID=206669 RepID=A0A9Q1C1T5_HOLLE|nr:ATP-dependent RNA helicase dhx29 [Holothuria leucospilota]